MAAGGVAGREPLGRAREHLRGEARPGVGHDDRPSPHRDHDRRRAVTGAVVEQVVDDPLEAAGIGEDPRRLGRVGDDAGPARDQAAHERVDVDPAQVGGDRAVLEP